MQLARSKSPAVIAAFAAIFLAVASLFALPGYTLTGTGVGAGTAALSNVEVYRLSHYMEQLPATKSKQAVIEMDTAKKFVMTMLRDLDRESAVSMLRDAYARNGYSDAEKMRQFSAALTGDLRAGSEITIEYNPERKTTTVTVGGGGTATVAGLDFMKATWSIWFGNTAQPKLGDELIARLP